MENSYKIVRKANMFVKLINAVPDNCIWGLQEFNNEIWLHYIDWNEIRPYLIKFNRKFDFIEPDIYILLTNESKKILTTILLNNPNSIECYFWHNIFFKEDMIFAEIIEGDESMDVLKELNIDITGNEDWVDFF